MPGNIFLRTLQLLSSVAFLMLASSQVLPSLAHVALQLVLLAPLTQVSPAVSVSVCECEASAKVKVSANVSASVSVNASECECECERERERDYEC